MAEFARAVWIPSVERTMRRSNVAGRTRRPSHIAVIMRGLPGSGKTYVSKLIRDAELKHGVGAPRMLCLDDYFQMEVEKGGKKVCSCSLDLPLHRLPGTAVKQ